MCDYQGICNRHKLTSCRGIKLYVTNPKYLTLTFNQFCTSNRIYVIGSMVIKASLNAVIKLGAYQICYIYIRDRELRCTCTREAIYLLKLPSKL